MTDENARILKEKPICGTCDRKMKLIPGTTNQWYCRKWTDAQHLADAKERSKL